MVSFWANPAIQNAKSQNRDETTGERGLENIRKSSRWKQTIGILTLGLGDPAQIRGEPGEWYAVPPRLIARVGYSEIGESLIWRITQRRLLIRFHNQCLDQLIRGV